MKDEFYIGWSNDNPKAYTKLSKRFLVVVLVSFLLVASAFTLSENGFINSYFEFGHQHKETGFLVDTPVWAIVTKDSKMGTMKTIPMVGFGKFGPEQIVNKWFQENSDLKVGSEVSVKGTRFGYQNREWLELTDQEKSLVSFSNQNKLSDRTMDQINSTSICGEIVDPKCLFGVMNPADKAVHRSCAIRCISGGNPPILAIRENGKFVDYFFLTGRDMEPVHQDILPYVGIPVQVEGLAHQTHGWKWLEMDNISIISSDSYSDLCR